jgi:hypothetical protein
MSEEVFRGGQEPTFFDEFCTFLFIVFLTVDLIFLTVNLTKTARDSTGKLRYERCRQSVLRA